MLTHTKVCLMKSIIIFWNKRRNSEISGIFYIFANPFSVWLNRRQPYSDIRSCIPSDAIAHITYPLNNSTVCLRENKSEKGKKHLRIIRKVVLISLTPSKGLGNVQRPSGQPLRTAGLDSALKPTEIHFNEIV